MRKRCQSSWLPFGMGQPKRSSWIRAYGTNVLTSGFRMRRTLSSEIGDDVQDHAQPKDRQEHVSKERWNDRGQTLVPNADEHFVNIAELAMQRANSMIVPPLLRIHQNDASGGIEEQGADDPQPPVCFNDSHFEIPSCAMERVGVIDFFLSMSMHESPCPSRN